MDGQTGLVLEDCGTGTFMRPPDDEVDRFRLFMRAHCVMERCLAAGFVHDDMEFRNVLSQAEVHKGNRAPVESRKGPGA